MPVGILTEMLRTACSYFIGNGRWVSEGVFTYFRSTFLLRLQNLKLLARYSTEARGLFPFATTALNNIHSNQYLFSLNGHANPCQQLPVHMKDTCVFSQHISPHAVPLIAPILSNIGI